MLDLMEMTFLKEFKPTHFYLFIYFFGTYWKRRLWGPHSNFSVNKLLQFCLNFCPFYASSSFQLALSISISHLWWCPLIEWNLYSKEDNTMRATPKIVVLWATNLLSQFLSFSLPSPYWLVMSAWYSMSVSCFDSAHGVH